jgi:hypothetical protein
MDDDAQLLEILQIPVDGREVDIGRPGLNPAGQLLSRLMAVSLKDRLEQQATGRRHPSTPLPDQSQDVLDRGGGGPVDVHRGEELAHAPNNRALQRLEATWSLLHPVRISG